MKPFVDREFRAPRWIVASTALGALIFPLVAWSLCRKEGLTLLTLVSFGMCVLAVGGLLDALTSFVRVTDRELVVRTNLRRRSYPRSAFVTANWAKGSPVALELREGGWLRLPPVGSSAQGVVNTLRAWLKVPN